MRPQDVTFRTVTAEIDEVNGDDKREMDIIEIRYPHDETKVSAFPATSRSPETGQRYCDMFPAKYNAFKNGNPDPDRVAELRNEIAARQGELDALQPKSKDDKRITDDLGYTKANDKSNRAAADHSRRKRKKAA